MHLHDMVINIEVPDENPGIRPGELLPGLSCGLEGFISYFKKLPLHRIHGHNFASVHTKEGMVEKARVLIEKISAVRVDATWSLMI